MIKNKIQNSKLKKVCIYYGYPSIISGSYDINQSVKIFLNYNIIVLGDGYNFPTHEAHRDTCEIIKKIKGKNPSIEIFGYVPCAAKNGGLNLTLEDIEARIELWYNIGVSGIFLDEFGYDYCNTRKRQNDILDFCHKKSLTAFVNSWNDDWIFSSKDIKLDWIQNFHSNPDNLKSHLTENDYFLYENMFWTVINGKQKKTSISMKNRVYNYYHTKKNEFSHRTYFEEFRTKPIALDGIKSNMEKFILGKFLRFLSLHWGKKLGLFGIAFADENNGASGNFIQW